MGESVSPERVIYQDFSGGINLAASPYLAGKKQSALIIDMVYDEHGALQTRDGTLIQDQTAPANVRIVALIDWVKMNVATPKKFALGWLTTDSRLRLYDRTTNPWTVIGPNPLVGNPGYLLPQFVPFSDRILISVGFGGPYYYTDGTTVSVSGGDVPPGVRHLAVHLNSVFALGTAATSSQKDGPSTLRVSVPATSTVLAYTGGGAFPFANATHIDKDDGDFGTGMGEFTVAETGISPTSTIIVTKNFAMYQVTGLPGSTTPLFSIQKVKSDMGCIAGRTMRFAPGFGLIRLTHRGFAMYDGVNDQLISEELRPYLFASDGYSPGIQWASAALSHAIVVPNPPMYLCWVPINSSFPDTVFAYDLVRQVWTILTYPNAASCSYQRPQLNPTTNPPGPTGVVQVLTGDTSAGNVRRIFAGDTTDDGAAISWSAIFHRLAGASPQANAYFRRAVLKLINVTNGQTITWGVIFGPNVQGATPRNKTGTLTTPNAAAPLATFNGTTLVPQPELDMTMDLGMIGTNLQMVLSGLGPITMRGLEYHVSPKPVSRPTVFA